MMMKRQKGWKRGMSMLMAGCLLSLTACGRAGDATAAAGTAVDGAAVSTVDGSGEGSASMQSAATGTVSVASDTERLVDTTTADGRVAALSLADRSYSVDLPAYNDNYDYEAWTQADTTLITMDGSEVTVQGSGAAYTDGVVEITKKGTYVLSGTLLDGQIHVDAGDDNVRLILNGVTITNDDGPAIYAESAKNLYVSLEAGTTNTVSDGAEYVIAEGAEEVDAAIYSKCDLILNGTGTLVVNGNYDGGIHSKDDLVLREGSYEVSAVGDGVKGKDGVYVYDGSYTVTAGGKGFVATNTEDADKGSIYCEGGSFNVSSTDDAFHSNSDVLLLGGDYVIESGDDGIHADAVTLLYGSVVVVQKSYEGIEGAVVDLAQSYVWVTASDDGINAAGDLDEEDSEDGDDMRSFGGFMDGNEDNVIYIDGGSLYVNADGDGIDSNGYVYIYDGEIVVDGPENDGNGYLDCGIAIRMYGGTLVGAGSSGMLETISEDSDVASIVVGLESTVSGGTVTIVDEDGVEVASFTPAKRYSSVTFAGYGFTEGVTYEALRDGESLGTVTISGAVNTIGNVRGGMGGFGGDRPDGGDGGRGGFGGGGPRGGDGDFDGSIDGSFDGGFPDGGRGGFGGGGPRGGDGDFDGSIDGSFDGGFPDGGRGGFGGGPWGQEGYGQEGFEGNPDDNR